MRRIIFLRHGKTENASESVSDHDRKLLPEGLEDAEKVGASISEHKIDLILTSSAQRTLQTANVVAKVIDYPSDNIKTKNELYNPSLEELLEVIHAIDDQYNSVMLVGHNPGFTECSNLFCGVNNIILSTCNYSIIDFDCGWSELSTASGKLLVHGKP